MGRLVTLAPPGTLPTPTSSRLSRLGILFFIFHLEVPFCAAFGQRTRGRRPNRARRKLLTVTLKLVCEGRALEAAVGSSANRAAEGMLFEQKKQQPWSTSAMEYELVEGLAGRKWSGTGVRSGWKRCGNLRGSGVFKRKSNVGFFFWVSF